MAEGSLSMTDKPWTAPGLSVPERTLALIKSFGRAWTDEREVRDDYVVMCERTTEAIEAAVRDAAQRDWVRGLEEQAKLETAIAALTPLAEEGRKAVKREIGDLLKVAGHLPDEYWRCPHTLGTCLSDAGRERLAYLRGLVGEEAAG
jgi:hypothetical protein